MANKYIKHIVILLACWLSLSGIAFGQSNTPQDSSAIAPDNYKGNVDTVVDEPPAADSATSLAYDKFLTRRPQATVKQRRLPDSSVQKLKKDADFWYANKEVGKPKVETQEDKGGGFWDGFFKILGSDLFRLIFWILVIGGFIAIIVMFLTSGNVSLFAARSKKLRGAGMETEDISDNIFTIDFETRINKALGEQNYRLATRLLFLKSLRAMTERGVINYGIDKTNMDYMFELGNTCYFKEFAQASRMYEYVWYGNFAIGQSQFLHIQQQIDQLTQKING